MKSTKYSILVFVVEAWVARAPQTKGRAGGSWASQAQPLLGLPWFGGRLAGPAVTQLARRRPAREGGRASEQKQKVIETYLASGFS